MAIEIGGGWSVNGSWAIGSGDAPLPPVTTGSAQFNGSNQYLSLPSNSAFDQNGLFTVEAWVYPISSQGSAGGYICAELQPNFLMLAYNNSGNFFIDQAYVGIQVTSSTTYPVGSWYHVAMSCDGTTTRLFVNGILQGSFAGTGGVSGETLTIGSYAASVNTNYKGYISNLRWVKGTALYTSNFTPSAIPLTAIAGTQLLTCQSHTTITDASTNAFTITNNGSAVATTSNPFIGGSTLFNGSGAYLSASAPALPTGNSSFTTEAWIYMPTAKRNEIINWGTQNNSQLNAFRVNVAGNGLTHYFWFNDLDTGNIGLVANTWYHVVAQYDGTTRKIFVNGVLKASDTPGTVNVTGTNVLIGQINSDYYGGYISNLRVCNIALYPGTTYTVPTAPLTAVSGTQLLTCQSTTSATTDASVNAYTITNNGSAVAAGVSPFYTLS